jgi:hypothetical protein
MAPEIYKRRVIRVHLVKFASTSDSSRPPRKTVLPQALARMPILLRSYLGVDTSTDQSAADPSTRKVKVAEHVGDAEVEDERKMLSFSLLA